MAQPQQQYSMPPRPFSPPQTSTSPATPQQFVLPPNKRQRLSPNPTSQPGSPYVQSPYGMSPNSSAPPSAGASPHFSNVQLPPNVYNTPYSNGHTTPGLSLPQSQPLHQSQPPHQSPLNLPNQNPLTQQQNNYSIVTQGPGTMGPPSKPVEKPKEDVPDPMDVLGGTGIDLRAEEQYESAIYNTSFNSQLSGSQSGTISSGHSFTQFPPGDEASFYGAGPANAAPEQTDTKSLDEFQQRAAQKAWYAAAQNLATSRQRELNNPFLNVALVHAKAARIARDNGLDLKTDSRGQMGTMKLPEHFGPPEVKTDVAVGPSSTLVTTSGTFLPADVMLVDHLALLSIATKHRLRSLVEDAAKFAIGRRTGSHGIIPDEWADAAALSSADNSSLVLDGAPRSGWESAVSPLSNPLKRSFSAANKLPTPTSSGGKSSSNNSKITNEVAVAFRASAVKEREFEEARLRKRLDRISGDGAQRQGSVIPGTPGSVAPESMDKVPTKKEQKKKAEAKVNEAASHAAANVATAQFLGGGGGGGGLFGKKKKYSWMTGGGTSGTASGASTPGRIMTQGLSGTPGGPVVNATSEKLTVDSARRLGQWREDKEKGIGIQVRDWITVLEQDGHEKKALQKSYLFLDLSEPK